MKIMMVDPQNYSLEYSINPWMNTSMRVNKKRAKKQWENLAESLSRIGIYIEVCESRKGLPDMVFAANAGLVDKRKAIVSNFRDRERKGEAKYFTEWFREHDFEVLKVDNKYYWEGEACSIKSNGYLLASYGQRAHRKAYAQIQKYVNLDKVKFIELIDPYFYHLDVCYSPIDQGVAMVCPLGFTRKTYVNLKKIIPDIIDVSYDDALNFGCNVFAYKKHIFISKHVSDTLKSTLSLMGFTVHEIDISEFIKSGGGVKCLILNL